MNTTKAIILAAGKSKRLGKLTENIPKCLLSLGSKTILEHQVDNLNRCGIHDITIIESVILPLKIGIGTGLYLLGLFQS